MIFAQKLMRFYMAIYTQAIYTQGNESISEVKSSSIIAGVGDQRCWVGGHPH
jgi:hypothetical protein